MPKKIDNLRQAILQQAKQLLLEKGYEAFTMRDTARGCGIAVGTLYNYFASKEMLAAGVMLEDWRAALRSMGGACEKAATLAEGLAAVYDGVVRFSDPYRGIWAGHGAGAQMPDYARRHRLLVRQLADCLAPLLARTGAGELPQADVFLAENILICAGTSELEFASLCALAQRLVGALAAGKEKNHVEL